MLFSLLTERTVVRVTGEDRFKFLQGLITNDVNKIKASKAIYACFLTPQGKYFADLFLVEDGESILMDIPSSRSAEIISKLNMYKLRSKVNFDNSSELEVVSMLGAEVFSGINFVDPRSKNLGLRGYIYKRNINIQDYPTAYDLARIKNFIPEGEKDLKYEQSFILEYGFDDLNAIDYKKGCYVGQELTARTHYRGEVRKKIAQVEGEGQLPPYGAIIFAEGKKLGTMCSSLGNLGLALIRLEEVNNLDRSTKIIVDMQEIKLKFKEN